MPHSAQTACASRTDIKHCPSGSGRWVLRYCTYVVGCGIMTATDEFDTRGEATKQAIRLAFTPQPILVSIKLAA